MNKAIYIIALNLAIVISACSPGSSDASKQQQIESQIKSDEERMDSLEKAIQLQMDAVSDDSIENQTTTP